MPHLLPAAASAIAAAAPAAAAGAAKAGVMATLKSVAFKAITNMAISAALSALQPQVGGQGGRTFEWTIDPDAPIPFAAGQVGVAGSVVHRDTFGPDLMYYGIPAVLSGAGPITGYDSVKADDFLVTFDATGKAITSTYAGELWFKSTLGNQPDVALSSPTGLKNGASLPGWTSAHKLSGKAAYMVVMGENSKGSAFPTGEIKPLITFRGLKGWDPRLDSTYPGGSGSCRLDNPATWVYLTNPILWALKWSLGLWEGPTGKGAPQVNHQVGGIGAKLSGIDVPAFVAAANIADANNWKVSAYPNTDDDKHQVLEAFLQAGGAIYSQRAGKISCIQRAAPRTSIVTISAADTAGPLEIDTAASRIDRINTIRPRFWSPAHRWQMTAMDEVTAASYQTEDGGKRTRGIDYPFVSNAKQAGQLAALQIANTREGIAGVIPLKPHLQRIRPGDAFTITEAGFVLNGLKCLCLNTDYDPATGVVRVSFVSETDAKYPFALGQDPTPPEPQVLTPVDPGYVTPPQIGDWTIVPRPPALGGGQLPGFDLGGIVSNNTATSIIVEHGPTNTGPWTQAYEGPPTVTGIPIDGLQPGATYYIAIQYRRDNNYSARSIYGPYTAPALIGDVMPDAPGLDQIKNDIQEAFGDLLDLDLDLAAARLALEQADAALAAEIGGVENRADALEILTTSLEANKASIAQLNAQITRINNVEAVNATQATALIDLGNNKVALTEYNTLKAEVQNARDGSPTLLGNIQQLKAVDLDLQNNKASTESVTNLTARTTQTEADIIDLELAQANETSARVAAVNQITARQAREPLANVPFDSVGTGYYATGTSTNTTQVAGAPETRTNPSQFLSMGMTNTANGWVSRFAGARRVLTQAAIPLPVGRVIEVVTEWNVSTAPTGTGVGRFAMMGLNGDFTYYNGDTTPNFTFPTGVTGRVTKKSRWARSGHGLAGVNTVGGTPVNVRPAVDVMNFDGMVADLVGMSVEDVTDGALLEASVTEQSLAIIDLENQQALASWQVVAAAAGGKPARIGLTSSTLGSFIALDAPYIFWGDNTVFNDATDTLQTTIGGYRRVLAFGAPFGASGNLLEWWGPDSIALGAMTTANGLNGRMATAPYVFDNVAAPAASALVVGPSTTSGGGLGAIPANYATIGSVSFTNVPAGGAYEVDAGVSAPSGAAVSGAGVFTGALRIVEIKGGTTNVVYGPVAFTADQHGMPGGLVDVAFLPPSGLLTQTENGAVTLAVQIARTSGSTTVSGLRTTVAAKWTKKG